MRAQETGKKEINFILLPFGLNIDMKVKKKKKQRLKKTKATSKHSFVFFSLLPSERRQTQQTQGNGEGNFS